MYKFLFYLALIFFPISGFCKIDYVIGFDPSWYPTDLKEKTPQVNAFVNELFSEIGRKAGSGICIAEIPWNLIYEYLKTEKIDGIVSFYEPTPLSLQAYDFSEPFLLIGPVLVVPVHSSAKSLNELSGKTVGISPYNDSILVVQKYPDVLMKHYDNMAFALNDLDRGKLDGVLMDKLEAEGLICAFYPDSLKIVTDPLTKKGLRLFVLKGRHKTLIKFFNDTLNQFEADGTYKKVLEEYSLTN